MDNIIHTNNSTIIMNGGNPLKDCPTNWEDAGKWLDEANKHLPLDEWENWKDETESVRNQYVLWTFDCGFKLDYDGALLNVSSRFYPPKTHYGATWDGTVHINVMGKEIANKSFDCPTLEQLKSEVETFINTIEKKVIEALEKIEI